MSTSTDEHAFEFRCVPAVMDEEIAACLPGQAELVIVESLEVFAGRPGGTM